MDPPDARFAPLSPERSSQRIADVIRRTILEGSFRPGDHLPPERTLAERFGVTRNTVREALRNLEQLRLVSIRQGSGVTVQDYLATAGIELVSALLVPDQGSSEERFADLLEARCVVGAALCGHAVDTLKKSALPPLFAAVDAFAAEAGRARPETKTLLQLDFEVQHQLLRAGGNRVFVLLHNSLRHVYERVALRFARLMREPSAVAAAYRAMAEALRRGDRAAARRSVDDVFALTSGKRRERP